MIIVQWSSGVQILSEGKEVSHLNAEFSSKLLCRREEIDVLSGMDVGLLSDITVRLAQRSQNTSRNTVVETQASLGLQALLKIGSS